MKILNLSLVKIGTLGFFIAAVLALGACSNDKSQPNYELIQDFMESPAIRAQEFDAASANNSGMRIPPENTQPRGFKPYLYGNDVERASRENKNPIAGDNSEEVLLTGGKMYETHCMVCHGMNGEGGANASVAQKMALKPPPLTSDKVKNMSDGQIYHIITKGQGVMGPYESHVLQKHRWQLVNYMRSLRKNN